MYAITFDSPAICSKHILHELRAQKSIVRSPLRQMLRKSRSSTLSIAYHMFSFYIFSLFPIHSPYIGNSGIPYIPRTLRNDRSVSLMAAYITDTAL